MLLFVVVERHVLLLLGVACFGYAFSLCLCMLKPPHWLRNVKITKRKDAKDDEKLIFGVEKERERERRRNSIWTFLNFTFVRGVVNNVWISMRTHSNKATKTEHKSPNRSKRKSERERKWKCTHNFRWAGGCVCVIIFLERFPSQNCYQICHRNQTGLTFFLLHIEKCVDDNVQAIHYIRARTSRSWSGKDNEKPAYETQRKSSSFLPKCRLKGSKLWANH